jgi:hypothetical protein
MATKLTNITVSYKMTVSKSHSPILKMEAATSSERFVIFYQIIQVTFSMAVTFVYLDNSIHGFESLSRS